MPSQAAAPSLNKSPAHTLIPRLLTISEAARYCSCAVWAIRSAIWAKELKACKIGRRFVIPREELDAYVDRLINDREHSGYQFQS
jgi:excisionase family DNA binding protein